MFARTAASRPPSKVREEEQNKIQREDQSSGGFVVPSSAKGKDGRLPAAEAANGLGVWALQSALASSTERPLGESMCEPQATDLGDLAADVASAFNIQALNDLGDGIGAFCVQDLLELLGHGTAQQVLLQFGKLWPNIRAKDSTGQYKACGSFLRAASLPDNAADPLIWIYRALDGENSRDHELDKA